MKKYSFSLLLIPLALISTSLACNLPLANAPAQTAQVVVVTATTQPDSKPSAETQPVATQPANTQAAPTLTATQVPASPTFTMTNPPPSPTFTPTATQPPCNRASFVQDVSIPDGTTIEVGKSFTKTWRLKNTGSCTWTSGYQLIFVNGDQMSGPGSQSLTSGTITPGSTADITVNLVAPATAGTYRGNWKIREPGGATFGVSTGAFWVEIVAKNPAAVEPPPAEVKMPDLAVTEFTISPSTPIQGQNAHVRIGVYNHGNKLASQFTVQWFGLSTFPNPSCSWDVMEIIPPSGGKILQCDFVFNSWYPVNKTSLVIVATSNHVAESNESNNQRTISPFGVNKP